MSSRDVRIINLSSPEEKRWSRLANLAPRMEKLLRSLQHCGYEGEMGYLPARCPSCDAYENEPHADDCEMGAMIRDLDAPEPEET